MTHRHLLIVVLLLVPAGAGAQGLAGPFGGLFGRTPERTGKEYTLLEFRTAAGSRYDDAILDETLPAGRPADAGVTGGLNAGLGFERRSDRLRLNVNAGSAHQQFFRDPPYSATSYHGSGLLVAKLATRLSLDGAVNYARSPFFNLLPAASGSLPTPEVLVPGDPFAARLLENETFEGMVGFTSAYTRRSTLSASLSRRQTRFLDQSGNNFSLWAVRGMWTRKLTRDVAARVGYGREEIEQLAVGEGRFIHEVFDVGLDLAREISIARRTALDFTTQTSIIRETGGERRYRLNGGLGLTRGFNRTWAVSVSATRNTEFLPGFLEPIFSDGVSGTVSGMFADRVEWSAGLGASKGRIGFEALDDFITYTGSSRLSAGVTRRLGVYAEYAYYRYDMPPGASALVLHPQLSRQSVSVGLSAFVPLFSRVREPRDPR